MNFVNFTLLNHSTLYLRPETISGFVEPLPGASKIAKTELLTSSGTFYILETMEQVYHKLERTTNERNAR